MANMRIPFTIKPDTDAGASHYAKFGVGGYYSVKDISERNSIPKVRLEPGLVVYVKTTHETWQYLGDPDGWSRIIIPNLSEWTDLSERVKFLEDERVWVEESPGESTSDFLSDFAGETLYTASEIDEMMARKAEVVDNYYIVAPSCVHYGIKNIRVLVYQRNAEFGTYLISQDNLGPMGLQISYKIYNDRDVLLNTISVSVIEDGGFNITEGNIPESGRIVITLGVHSSRDYSVVDIYDSHEICVITGGEFIPTSLSDLTEDQDHRVVTDAEKRTWNRKQNALISGNTIKTVNNESLLGSGNITIEGNKQEQADWNQSDDTELDYIKNKPTLGTAAALNVALYGNASETEVVRGDDTRLTDSRTPTSHTHTVSQIADFPTIPTVPTNVSAFTNDAGYTTNTGTITSIKMNGSTVASSGEADLGTVVTDISNKQDVLVAGTNINIQTNIVSKNLWNPTNSTNSSPGFNATSRTVASDGTITITNNSGNTASRIQEEHTAAELGLENGKIYTLTFYCDSMSTDTNRKNILWYNGGYEQLNPASGTNYISVTWTQANNSKVQVGQIYFDNVVNGGTKSYKIQLEQGNVKTDYVAYNVGKQVPVISAIVPTISTDISTDATNDTKTTSPKAVKTFVEGKGYLTSETYTGTVTSTGGTVTVNNIQVVSALPASPDANTLYLIPES